MTRQDYLGGIKNILNLINQITPYLFNKKNKASELKLYCESILKKHNAYAKKHGIRT